MSERILVVEDSRAFRNYLYQQFKNDGYEVALAESVAEAKAILEQGTDFLCAVLDYCLPDGQDGEIIDKTSFLVQLTLVDMLGWAMSASAIFIILSAVNMKKAIGPLIIASNWFSLLAVYVFFIPDTLSFLLPALTDFIDVIDFIVYFMIVGLYYRLVKHVLGDQKMIAFAITLASVVMGLFLSSMIYQSVFQT